MRKDYSQRRDGINTFVEWKLIGGGGTGQVYRVLRKDGRGFQAVKVIPLPTEHGGVFEGIGGYHADIVRMRQQMIQETVEEARMLSQLHGRGIVPVREIHLGVQELFWYMEYVEGDSLVRIMEQKGALEEQFVIQTGIQLCQILYKLHCHHPQIVYRDVKPANILMDSCGKIYLADFGTAWVCGRGSRRDCEPLGTVGYAPPEQYVQGAMLNGRTDIYALGVTLMELLTGEYPWEQETMEAWMERWRGRISGQLLEVIEICTKSNPGERYPSCLAVKKALCRIDRRRSTGYGRG